MPLFFLWASITVLRAPKPSSDISANLDAELLLSSALGMVNFTMSTVRAAVTVPVSMAAVLSEPLLDLLGVFVGRRHDLAGQDFTVGLPLLLLLSAKCRQY